MSLKSCPGASSVPMISLKTYYNFDRIKFSSRYAKSISL